MNVVLCYDTLLFYREAVSPDDWCFDLMRETHGLLKTVLGSKTAMTGNSSRQDSTERLQT